MYFLVDPDIRTIRKQLCYSYDKAANKKDGKLHLSSFFCLDERVQKCVVILGKNFQQAKLLNRDMIAQDAICYQHRLTDLYKKANAAQLDRNYSKSKKNLQ